MTRTIEVYDDFDEVKIVYVSFRETSEYEHNV